MDRNGFVPGPKGIRYHLSISLILAVILMAFLNEKVLGWPTKQNAWLLCGVATLVLALILMAIQKAAINSYLQNKLRRYVRIQRGMSPEQVVDIMGRHYSRSFDEYGEVFVWSTTEDGYAYTSYSNGFAATTYTNPSYSRVVVRFQNGFVVSVNAEGV